jgi:hypothetical protein
VSVNNSLHQINDLVKLQEATVECFNGLFVGGVVDSRVSKAGFANLAR